MNEKLEIYYRDEIVFHLNNDGIIDITIEDLSSIKMIFVKYYSDQFRKKTLFILRNKLYFLLYFINSDNLEYIDEDNYYNNVIDTLHLFSFKIKEHKYYLLFSKRYSDCDLKFKKEKIEFFMSE